MPESGTDPVGRAISPEAQAARDAKLHAPEDNLASNPAIAKRASLHVENYLKSCESSRILLNDKMVILYNLWNGDPISRHVATSRSVHVPEPKQAVEAFVCRAVSMLIGKPGWFRTVGMDQAGKKNSKAIADLIRAELRLDGFATKAADFVRSTAIYGWCPSKLRWKFRRRKIKYNRLKEVPKTEDGTQTGATVSTEPAELEVNLDGPTVEYTDPYDFMTDLRFHDHQESLGIMFRHEVHENQLLEEGKRGFYKNVKALIDADKTAQPGAQVQGPGGTLLTTTTFREIRDMADGLSHQNELGVGVPSSRMYELFEFWGLFDPNETEISQGEQKECVITLARKFLSNQTKSGWTCLRVAENPWWHGRRPAAVAHYTRRAHCFQSVGIIEPIVRLSSELDDSRNMALAARALASKPCFIADDSADLYSNQLVLNPGDVLRGRTTEAIKPLFIPDRSDVAYKSETAIKADIQATTGIPKVFQGGEERERTATAHVGRTREANKRIAEAVRNIAEHFLVPMLEMFHAMNQQMITEERLIEIIGEDGLVANIQKITPADVAGRVHFEIAVLPQIEMSGIEAQMRMSFMNGVAPFVQVDPGMMDVEAMASKTYENMFGSADLDDIFPRRKQPKHMRTVYEEHMLMAHGHALLPQDGENLNAHISGHVQFVATEAFDNWDEDSKRRMIAHVENTKIAMQRQIEEQVIPAMPGMPPPGGQAPEGQGPQGGVAGNMRGLRRPMPGGGAGGATPEGMVRSNMASIEPRAPQAAGAI